MYTFPVCLINTTIILVGLLIENKPINVPSSINQKSIDGYFSIQIKLNWAKLNVNWFQW